MEDPAHTETHRLERDAKNWLVDYGPELLRDQEVNLGELAEGAPDSRAAISQIREVKHVRLRVPPRGTKGEERAHFTADVLFACAPLDDETGHAPPDQPLEDVPANVDFELSLLDGRIAPDPQFAVLSVSRTE